MKYRTFVYTPRSGSRICVRKDARPRTTNNMFTVHKLRNSSYVVWSRFPQIELLREGRTLSRKDARYQLLDVLCQQLPNSVIVDNCGEISVIPANRGEYQTLQALCSALGVGAQVAKDHALQALACGQGGFIINHERGGQVIPAPEPPVVSTDDPFPLHPEADQREVPATAEGLTLSAFASRMQADRWCADGLAQAAAEIATEAGWDLQSSPHFHYDYGEGGARVFDLPIEVILRSSVAGERYPAQRAAIFKWAEEMATEEIP